MSTDRWIPAENMLASLHAGCDYSDIDNPTGPYMPLRHDGSEAGSVPATKLMNDLRCSMALGFVNGIGRHGADRPYLFFTAREDFARMDEILGLQRSSWWETIGCAPAGSRGPAYPVRMVKYPDGWRESPTWTRVPAQVDDDAESLRSECAS